MRVHLTDGTHTVEIQAKGYSRRQLDDAEASALRILNALRDIPPTITPPAPFGFTPDTALDGVSLDSSTERAEPYDDDRGYDDEDDEE
ncbi:hypothetical protein ABZ330_21730 [Streptomyces sp. NPDC006172]|uniref:hypothetical protein n=1 Tax=Streptomyces sp. NPDC006172 TaxID=3154470 RepID=UPI0033D0CAD4